MCLPEWTFMRGNSPLLIPLDEKETAWAGLS